MRQASIARSFNSDFLVNVLSAVGDFDIAIMKPAARSVEQILFGMADTMLVAVR